MHKYWGSPVLPKSFCTSKEQYGQWLPQIFSDSRKFKMKAPLIILHFSRFSSSELALDRSLSSDCTALY